MAGIENTTVEGTTVAGSTVEGSTVEGGGGGPPPPPVGVTQFSADWTGSDGATSYVEESANAASATFVGGSRIETDQFVSSPSSLFLNGTTGNVSFPAISEYALGNSDFNIQSYARFSSLDPAGNSMYIMSQMNQGLPFENNRSFSLFYLGGGNFELRFFYNLTLVARAWVPTINVWYKINVVRVGADLGIFIDDVQLGLTENIGLTIIPEATLAPLRFGATFITGGSLSSFFSGYIDNSRIVVG